RRSSACRRRAGRHPCGEARRIRARCRRQERRGGRSGRKRPSRAAGSPFAASWVQCVAQPATSNQREAGAASPKRLIFLPDTEGVIGGGHEERVAHGRRSGNRSEERRVGKECRNRRSGYRRREEEGRTVA